MKNIILIIKEKFKFLEEKGFVFSLKDYITEIYFVYVKNKYTIEISLYDTQIKLFCSKKEISVVIKYKIDINNYYLNLQYYPIKGKIEQDKIYCNLLECFSLFSKQSLIKLENEIKTNKNLLNKIDLYSLFLLENIEKLF